MKPRRKALVLGLLCLSAEAAAWTSARVYPAGTGLAYTYDAEGTRIPDFSYAGYEEGCKPIPNAIPVVMTLTPVAGDNTTNINNALNAVAAMPMQANGYRGALLLKPGTYNVGGVVQVGGNGVVLRGSGSGTNPAVDSILFSTRTDFDAVTDRGEYPVVSLGKANASPTGFRAIGGSSVNITTPWVKVGDNSFQVSSVASFAVGDWVVISHPITAAWLATVNGGDTASGPAWAVQGSIVMERRITAIDAATNTLHINGGVFHHLKQALSQCTVGRLDRQQFVDHSGIEDLHVDVTHTSMVDEHHAKNAIRVDQAQHCWVRNTASRYYWHGAVVTTNSAYVTVQANQGSQFAGIVMGERAYTFSAEGNTSHILFTKNNADGGRHNYISSASYSSTGIVFYDNDSSRSTATIEAHMRWSSGILFDNIRDVSSTAYVSMGVYNRGDYGQPYSHGWACANCVIWNSVEAKNNIICQKPPTAQNYVIGSFTGAGKQVTGASPPAPYSQPTGFVEGVNASGLAPASLYLAQLAARTDCPMTTPVSTPVASFTRTSTATVTCSATRTVTVNATVTATSSATASVTGTMTRTATPTSIESSTRTITGTITSTATPSSSASATPTSSPNASGTPSASATRTATANATGSATLTAGSSYTRTVTPSVTGTVTPSASGTVTATVSRTVSSTMSSTPTACATASASATNSPTPSPTPSSTPMNTASATATAAARATRTPTLSATPTGTQAMPSVTATATLTVTMTAAQSAPPSGGSPLVIRQVLPLPNPNPQSLWVDLEGPAERVRISVWSVGLTELLVGESGGLSAGAHTLPLPAGIEGLPSGTYFFRVEAFDAGRHAQAYCGKLQRLP